MAERYSLATDDTQMRLVPCRIAVLLHVFIVRRKEGAPCVTADFCRELVCPLALACQQRVRRRATRTLPGSGSR